MKILTKLNQRFRMLDLSIFHFPESSVFRGFNAYILRYPGAKITEKSLRQAHVSINVQDC